MKNNEPIRHHYIPQFILRNFCCDDNGHVNFYNTKLAKSFIRETKNVFMVPNLYRDEFNHPSIPTQIEKDFSKIECKAATIIKNKLMYDETIILTEEENKLLKFFFALMGLRSKYTHDKFSSFLSRESQEFYKKYQGNDNFEDFWKRNLSYIIKCRSLKEIFDCPNVDEPFKGFMCRDIYGYSGSHFVIADSSDNDKFIIGDCYPLVVTGTTLFGVPFKMYSAYPISPSRILILANNGVENCPRNVLVLRSSIFCLSDKNNNECLTLHVKHLKNYEVEHINSRIKSSCDEGYILPAKNKYIY